MCAAWQWQISGGAPPTVTCLVNCLACTHNICNIRACAPVTVSLSLFVSHTPSPLPSSHAYTRGKVDAALSAVHWEVLLLTVVWIEAAVHPLLSGCCRAAGLAFVLLSIMARHNYSLSTEGAQAASTLPLASPHLAGQRRQTQADTSFMCVLKWNVSVCDVSHSHSNGNTCSWQILKGAGLSLQAALLSSQL